MNFWGKKNNLNIFTHAPPPQAKVIIILQVEKNFLLESTFSKI